MRLFTLGLCTFLLVGMASAHWLGYRNAENNTQPKGHQGDEKTDDRPPKGQAPYAAQPSKEAPPTRRTSLPQIRERADPVTCYADAGTVRRVPVYPVPCADGPASNRTHLLPVNPVELLRLGSLAVWVPVFEPFRLAGKVPPGQQYAIGYLGLDKERMELAAVGVYVLEESKEGPRLAFEGEFELADYGKFLGLEEMSEKTAAVTHLSIRTSQGTLRKQVIHLTKCVGGPADGKSYPLLVEPSRLFESGVGLVGITEVAPRPHDQSFVLSRDRKPPKPFVGHMSFYALERLPEKTFQLRFIWA